jgi:hypothetical protein
MKPWARPVRTDLPSDSALAAATPALAFQVAWRWLRFPFEVFFFGTAMFHQKDNHPSSLPAALLSNPYNEMIEGIT